MVRSRGIVILLPLAGISFQHVSVQVEDDHILVIKTNLPSATSASPTVEASNVKDGRSLRPGEGNGTSSANQATRHVNYRVPFPRSSINADNINAKFRDGLLLMLIPKVPISLRNIPVAS
ncbi:hypothetical protein IWQ60_009841 [Tieghemiomyces parasiticus]|uniref:SHSP domain-containing protein n=1 Tax=Tieghemiomyces parasiticus TaxID=78921 RepID=A0A9W8DKI2_9FUNG|nr:hypothetical protein IWQ60_009841 [Tieghemiomyces parasiticus]